MKLSSRNKRLKRGVIVPSNVKTECLQSTLKSWLQDFNAQIYVVMVILDYSRVIIYELHYIFKTRFANE